MTAGETILSHDAVLDVGVPIPAQEVQFGLNFAEEPPRLFVGREMGEDALRVLKEIIALQAATHPRSAEHKRARKKEFTISSV